MIDNDTYLAAWNDPDHRRIMDDAARPYRGRLDPDEVLHRQQMALLRCLATHREGGRKFTTSLHEHVAWGLANEARSLQRWERRRRSLRDHLGRLEGGQAAALRRSARLELESGHVAECLARLDEPDRWLIERHYLRDRKSVV